jgi:hypothetical protein
MSAQLSFAVGKDGLFCERDMTDRDHRRFFFDRAQSSERPPALATRLTPGQSGSLVRGCAIGLLRPNGPLRRLGVLQRKARDP